MKLNPDEVYCVYRKRLVFWPNGELKDIEKVLLHAFTTREEADECLTKRAYLTDGTYDVNDTFGWMRPLPENLVVPFIGPTFPDHVVIETDEEIEEAVQ